jgi:hypothetical protein
LQPIEVAQLVEEVARAERCCCAAILGQVVVGQHNDDRPLCLVAGNRAQHAKSGALPQMQIEQQHVHRLTLQCRDGIRLAVHGPRELHPGHAEQRLAQPLGQHP